MALDNQSIHYLWSQLVRKSLICRYATSSEFWFIFYERGWIELGGIRLRTSYPVLPWIGIITLGYCIGSRLFDSKQESRNRNTALLGIGVISISLFFILRFINLYGDQAWSMMPSLLETSMSFLT